MAEKREISNHYTAMAIAWINNREELRHLKGATIIYLESSHQKRAGTERYSAFVRRYRTRTSGRYRQILPSHSTSRIWSFCQNGSRR